MGGREGIVDTSVKTADTGYLQRRIMKSLESIVVQYDGTVRDSGMNVVEVVYGGDGCDASQLERVNLFFLAKTREELREDFGIPPGGSSEEFERALELFRECLDSKITFTSPELETKAYLPVNIPLLLMQQTQQNQKTEEKTEDTAEKEVLDLEREKLLRYLEEEKGRIELRQTLFLRASVAYFLRSTVVTSLRIFKEFRKFYDLSQVNPGECVGTLAANSVGEPGTQLTLNTFHHAGVAAKNVTLGVPRLKELIDARRNVTASFAEVMVRQPFNCNRRFVRELRQTIPEIFLKDCIRESVVVMRHEEVKGGAKKGTSFLLQFDSEFSQEEEEHSTISSGSSSICLIRMDLDRNFLRQRNLTIVDVVSAMYKSMPNRDRYRLIYSELNMEEWVVYVQMLGLEKAREQYVKRFEKKQQKQDEKQTEEEVDKKDNRSEFDRSMAYQFLKYMQETVRLGGVHGVKSAKVFSMNRVHVDPETLVKNTRQEYCIQTTGTNLRELWEIPMVDWTRTSSNNIHEIAETLGIEAAATVLFHEIRTVLSFDGSYVNDRHMMMIANVITRGGYLMPLNRHGLNRLSTVGPLVKSTFEETVELFFDAGAFAEANPVNSISDNIIFGQTVPGGTGLCQLRLSDDLCERRRSYEKQKSPTLVQEPKRKKNKKRKYGEEEEEETVVVRTFYIRESGEPNPKDETGSGGRPGKKPAEWEGRTRSFPSFNSHYHHNHHHHHHYYYCDHQQYRPSSPWLFGEEEEEQTENSLVNCYEQRQSYPTTTAMVLPFRNHPTSASSSLFLPMPEAAGGFKFVEEETPKEEKIAGHSGNKEEKNRKIKKKKEEEQELYRPSTPNLPTENKKTTKTKIQIQEKKEEESKEEEKFKEAILTLEGGSLYDASSGELCTAKLQKLLDNSLLLV